MYTKQQLETILTGLMVFSGANNNQGLRFITGSNYGERVIHIIKTFDNLAENEGLVTFTSKLSKP